MTGHLLAFVTNSGDGTVSTFRVGGDGSLDRVAVSRTGPGGGTLAVDGARGRVYVAVKGDPAGLLTCTVEDDGSLGVVARHDLPAPLQYLTLTRDGAHLLAASYPGGFGLVLPVHEDGVGAATSRVDFPNLHSCAVSADGGTAYFVSLGADLLAQYRLAGGVLVPLDPPTVAAPHGSGPRHLVLSADQTRVHVMTEFSGQVLTFVRDRDGRLTVAGAANAVDPAKGLTHSRFGADPTAGGLVWGADLHLSADQQVLWASERAGSTIATLPVGQDGIPGDATSFRDTEAQPRGFAVTPDGRYVLVAGERSGRVSCYATGPDGTLHPVGRAPTGAGANWIRFLQRPV